MKTNLILVFLAVALLIIACAKEPTPPASEGQDGIDAPATTEESIDDVTGELDELETLEEELDLSELDALDEELDFG